MAASRAVCLLLALGAAVLQPDAAAQARKQWRPATPVDIARQQALTANPVSAASSGMVDSSQAQRVSQGQQAYIDPLTNELISAPATGASALPAAAVTTAQDFPLQRTPEGYLYIDTREYRHIETAVLDSAITLQTQCSVQSPWSLPLTHPQPQVAPAAPTADSSATESPP